MLHEFILNFIFIWQKCYFFRGEINEDEKVNEQYTKKINVNLLDLTEAKKLCF